MRDRRRRLAVAGIALAALAAGVGGKALLDDDPADPCQPPKAAPPAQLALMPAGLSFERIGTVTRVRKDELHVMVRALTRRPLNEATVLIQDAVTAAGYRPAGMDNEGFEAEVFFGAGAYAGGLARLRATTCPGRWGIDLVLVDRNATPPTTTP